MRLLLYRVAEALAFGAWACVGFRPGRLAGVHYRCERRLRNEEG